eukprot:scaffold90805_cov40-Cyclotella_meneghiniana.AAC.1
MPPSSPAYRIRLPCWPLSLHPDVNCGFVTCAAVMVTAMATESSRPTPTKVAERFAMVLVGCGDD